MAENENYEKITLIDFAKKVNGMRTMQKAYFMMKEKATLFESKRLEREVDEIVKSVLSPKQKSIFDVEEEE